VPPSLVQEKLLGLGAYITWYRDLDPETPHFEAVQFMGARGLFRDENFRPQEMLTRSVALEWVRELACLEGRKHVMFEQTGDDCPVSRKEFASLLVESGEPDFAAQTFLELGDPNARITRAEGAFGLYLAHRDYALGSRAFSERIKYLQDVECRKSHRETFSEVPSCLQRP
jgi:hypothetical protein